MSLQPPSPDTTVLVTGASSGIGTELARQFAARGYNVVLVARRKERLDSLAGELRAANGINAQAVACDLADQQSRKKLIKDLVAGERTVTAVCNNAGFGSYGQFSDQPLENETGQIKLNVEALHELSGAFLPAMLERDEGAILNVASVAGFQPIPQMATYAATKAFVLAFSEALHTELLDSGVSCTALCPGPVPTEFSAVAGNEQEGSQVPRFMTVAAAEVARQGIEGMIAGKRTVVPGFPSRVLSTAGRITPRSLLLPVVSKFERNLSAAN